MNSLLYSRHWFSFLQRKVSAVISHFLTELSGTLQTLLLMVLVIFLPLITTNIGSGWALTLLSQENLSYASTCQTIGLNTGFFASFTVFLALNSEAFA
jgi:hypothetical protein